MKIDPATYYDEEYFTAGKTYRGADGNTRAYQGPALRWHGFEYILKCIQQALGNDIKSLLDLCCGGGDFVRYCRKAGIEAYGLDISQYAIENAGDDVRDHLGIADVLQLSIEDFDSYDVVTAFDALEHIFHEDHAPFISMIGDIAQKHIVFCIGASDDPDFHFFLEPGADVPQELESAVVPGHVSIAPWNFWAATVTMCLSDEWRLNWEASHLFQIAMIQTPQMVDGKGYPIRAWSATRVMVFSRSS